MKMFRKALFTILALVVTASLLVLPAAAADTAYGAGTVTASALNVRSGPDTTYSVVGKVHEEAIVVILEKTSDVWYKINYLGMVGYASAEYFSDVLTKENFNATGTISADEVIMRSAPDTSGKTLTSFKSGTAVSVIGINEGWYKVKASGMTGYVRSDLMSVTGAYVAAPAARTAVSSNPSKGQELVDFALGFVGSPYVYGGESPSGFDCSGLVYYVYQHFGYKLSRTATAQYNNNGAKVSKDELMPGDLVFFTNGGKSIGHVGIYIGDNEFVHASTYSTGVIVSRLDSSNNVRKWYGAKRIITE